LYAERMKRPTPEVLADLVPRFGAQPAGLAFLGGGQEWSDGTLYTFRLGAAERVLKVIAFAGSDRDGLTRAEERVAYVRSLAEAGCRVVLPERSPSGRLFETIDREDATWLAYSYRKAPGRVVKDDDPWLADGSFFRALGGAVAGMHAATEARGDPIRRDGSSTACRALCGWREEWGGFHAVCRDEVVREAWERLRHRLELLPIERSGYGFVHNDAHAWNVIFDPHAVGPRPLEPPDLAIIDFDCSGLHWFGCDAAIAVESAMSIGTGEMDVPPGPPCGPARMRVEAFWDGYRDVRDPASALASADLFIQYRRILLYMVCQDSLEGRPEVRERWKRRILEAEVGPY
jgi:Ser/Thr protein kinase RdoA (MazF antagonist)